MEAHDVPRSDVSRAADLRVWLVVLALAAMTGCDPGVVDLKDIPRDRTLIVMNGGPNQYALFGNQNPYIPGSDQGFHMGTLPAVYEPLIMFNVLTGEHENWLAKTGSTTRTTPR